MKVTIQAYQFMDKLFLTKQEADTMSEGWEHKASVNKVYLSIERDDLIEAQQETDTTTRIEILEYAEKQVFQTYEEAEEETEIENGYIEEDESNFLVYDMQTQTINNNFNSLDSLVEFILTDLKEIEDHEGEFTKDLKEYTLAEKINLIESYGYSLKD